jgi:hypothetical protein
VVRAANPRGAASPRQHLRAIDPSATPEETAAIVAALERFRRVTARAAEAAPQPPAGWRRAALLEAVERDSPADVPNPWINT